MRVKGKPGSHIRDSRECRKVWGSEPSHSQGNSRFGRWSPGGLPKLQRPIWGGQISIACGALYINGKLLKRRCLKWALIAHLDIWNTSYDQKKGRESNSREFASFDSRPLKVGNRPEILGCRQRATYRWKDLDESYNFALDRTSIWGLLAKLWGLQSLGSLAGRDFGTPARESRERKAIWMWVSWRVTKYTIRGKVVASPKSGPWWVLCVCVARGSSQHQRCSNYALTSLCGLCAGPCEWISLSILSSPIPELQHAPLPLKVLWARERIPTLPSSAVFHLDSPLSPSRSWECVTMWVLYYANWYMWQYVWLNDYLSLGYLHLKE